MVINKYQNKRENATKIVGHVFSYTKVTKQAGLVSISNRGEPLVFQVQNLTRANQVVSAHK